MISLYLCHLWLLIGTQDGEAKPPIPEYILPFFVCLRGGVSRFVMSLLGMMVFCSLPIYSIHHQINIYIIYLTNPLKYFNRNTKIQLTRYLPILQPNRIHDALCIHTQFPVHKVTTVLNIIGIRETF